MLPLRRLAPAFAVAFALAASAAIAQEDAPTPLAISTTNVGVDAQGALPPVDSIGNPFAAAPKANGDMPFTLESDRVDYDLKADNLTASGNVYVEGPEGQLTADKLVYKMGSDLLTASGNVRFKDSTGNVLIVDKLELTGDLKKGAAQALRLRIPNLGEVMQASGATLNPPESADASATYTLNDVSYSPCKECWNGEKAWTLHSQEMTYDPGEGDMTYKGAVMDVYGVPVAYVPWFRHPVGPRKPKSGLLTPQFGRSTAHGEEFRIAGYVNSPAENADYTLRTRYMSQRGLLGQIERRQVTTHTESEIKASYLNDHGTGSKVRTHANVIGDYVFQPGLRVGVNGEIASDDTYLNDFFDRNDPYLASTAYGEWDNQDRYLALSVVRFQDLDPSRAPANTAQVLPHLEYDQNIGLIDGSWLRLGADMVSLQRGQGTQSRRIVTQANLEKPMVWDDGSKLTLAGRIRADFYNVDGAPNVAGADNGQIARFLPEATFDWEKPYISPGGYHTIAPRVMGALSFRGGNPPGIPNEDSVAYELDMANLFEPSRFAGLDRVETGPRLVYGLDNRWGNAYNTEWRFFAGQSLRKYDDNDLPQSGGAATPVSDWVTYAQAAPVEWFNLSQLARFDNATYEPRRLDTGLRLGWAAEDRPMLSTTYSFLDNSTENLNTEARIPLNDYWTFRGASQHDVRNSRTLEARGGLSYRRDCYDIGFTVRRRGFSNGDLRPSTDYMVNVQLLTLGAENE